MPTETLPPMPTETWTPEPTETSTLVPSETASPMPTETLTPTATRTALPTFTMTASPTFTMTASPTLTKTASPTLTKTATPTPTRTASPTPTKTQAPILKTLIFSSVAAEDGLLLESSETSTIGGTLDAVSTLLTVGDNAQKKQYRSVLSFLTASLPDNAVIVSATLKLKKSTASAKDPFLTHGPLLVDIKTLKFGLSPLLQVDDFAALAGLSKAGTIASVPVAGLYVSKLISTSFAQINKTGTTQMRMAFTLDDDNDLVTDFVSFFSGNNTVVANKPILEIVYYVP